MDLYYLALAAGLWWLTAAMATGCTRLAGARP